jgi:8-oxo-dGTP pyrophosphatase MutT (NUDIX family)
MKVEVLGFMVCLESRRILLQQRIDPERWAGLLNGFGGPMRADETPQTAMAREFEEECGIRTLPEDWHHKATLVFGKPDAPDAITHVLVSFGNIYAAQRTEAEHPQTRSLAEGLFRENVVHDLRWLVPLCLDVRITTPARVELHHHA